MNRNHLSVGDMEHIEEVKKILAPGDLITHKCCGDSIQEHYFIEFDGAYIVGKPTKETLKYSTDFGEPIHPLNVTHINREKVECIKFLDNFRGKKIAKQQ
ncbi:MAG TPA: hypothetical protein PLZ43_11210 [bacterium]|nr:hypothetical protein [bacterium]